MTWLKLGDEYPDDCGDLSDAAFRLHTEGLSFVMLRLTGGLIRHHEFRRVAGFLKGDADDALKELLSRGLWVEVDEGWLVVHQMEHQRTPEQVEAERQKWREKKARAAERQAARRRGGDS